MFDTQEITQVAEWEQAILQWPEANFLQSWWWGEFQGKLGKRVVRIALRHKGLVVALTQGVVEPARRGKYLAVAGGPLVDWQADQAVRQLLDSLRRVAQAEGCVFIRIRPQAIWGLELQTQFKRQSLLPAPMHLTADLTLQLDLALSDDQLLAAMRKQTRQSIRKAESLGIQTRVSTNPEDIDEFYRQQLEVAHRHGFVPFGREFLQQQFATFVTQNAACLVSAYLDDKLLATAFLLFYHGEAVYHYGVSTAENLDLPGSYACQWRAIHEARERGCSRYNFWGIAPKEARHHRFAGVSTFKRGFGGQEIQYAPAHDLPLKPQYWLMRGFELIRRKVRHLD